MMIKNNHKENNMRNPKKIFQIPNSHFLILFLLSFLLINLFWLLFIALVNIGLPFPDIKVEKFLDLGFSTISVFGIIVFLTLVPFQNVEDKLSPIFYAKIFNSPLAHFGLCLLMLCAVISFLAIGLQQTLETNKYLSQLFLALLTSIIFAILFHRFWALRCIYQPYIVYKYIKSLKYEESDEEIWLQLFECSFKAIKQGRLNDARNFIDLMEDIYHRPSNQEKIMILREDMLNLYALAHEIRPLARFIEEKWPFCFENH
jgi:hypothetical protein